MIHFLPEKEYYSAAVDPVGHHSAGQPGEWSQQREIFATKTFIEKIASAVAMMVVSSVLAIGAQTGEAVRLQGVKLTGIYAGVFSLLSLLCFILYNDRKVTGYIEAHTGKQKGKA